MPAPAFQPPDQPGVDLPAAPPALQQDTGTAPGGERLRAWAACAGLGLGAVALAWRVGHGLVDDGWPLADTLVWAGAGECLLGIGLLWFGLALVQDLWRLIYTRRLWRAQLDILIQGAATQRKSTEDYGRRWYAAQPKDPAPVVVNDQRTRETLARQEAAIARLEAQLSAAQRAPEPGAARVETIPNPIPDAETRPMVDARALLGGAYRNGPAWKLVQTAYRQAPITNGALVDGGWMSDDAWRALTRLLAAHGILTRKGKGPTAPYGLAPPYAGAADEAACHMAVLARLWAVGCGPGDLPGDLAGLDPAPTAAPTAAHSPDSGTDGPQ